MTPEERAQALVPGCEDCIAATIREAVLEEREAIAAWASKGFGIEVSEWDERLGPCLGDIAERIRGRPPP